MAFVQDTIRVEGLREFQRALKVADAALARETRDTLKKIADPVRSDAERLAVANIPRIGLPWSQMRIGVTQAAVYVAPKQRGKGRGRDPRRRPNLFDLLLGRALEPALAQNEERVRREFEEMLNGVALRWERV